ncbi:MAG: sulfatase [Candidatus Omnitrophota bacterium]|nr:sulfatase [Candidatus Omnitrophota bacterium]
MWKNNVFNRPIKMQFTNKRKYKYFIFFMAILLIAVIALNFFKKIKRPNIILITIDAVRADHLSCYGYGRFTTPNIDKLAAGGALFLQAIAPSTDTYYSVPAIITSTYSHYHGIKDKRNALVNPLVPTFAEILSKNNYCTGLFSNGYSFSHIKGVDRGFGTFVVNGNIAADELTNISLKWLKSKGKRNFLLWIHYLEPHAPYTPPFPYGTLYIKDKFNTNDKNISIGSSDKTWGGLKIIPYIVAQNNITSVNYYISQYDGEIKFVDEQIGVLLDKLKVLKLDKNTLIVITADHGESLGEHNRYFQHGGMPFDALLHVPLVFKYEPLALKDKKITRQVSSADIFPTILEILKIKCPKAIYGKSLLGLIQGKTKNRDPYIFIKAQIIDHNLAYSLRTEKWKLIYSTKDKKYYLYDLKNDKDELNDVKDIKKAEFKFLSKKLDEWRDREESVVFSVDTPSFDRDAIEKLKSLGYL